MALIKYAEGSVLNLVPDLAALRAADALEASTRSTAVAAEATSRSAAISALSLEITNALNQEIADRLAAEALEASTRATDIAAETTARIAAIQAEEAARVLGDSHATSGLDVHVAGPFTTLKDLVDVVNGDNLTAGSFRQVIDSVIGGAPAALDTLKKIADYIAVNPDANVADAITRFVAEAVAALKGDVTNAMDTLGEVEAAVTAEIANRESAVSGLNTTLSAAIATAEASQTSALSIEASERAAGDAAEATARAASELALQTALKLYADSVASKGGSLPKIEYALVTGDSIVLSNAPKSGVYGIMNFGNARYVDNNDVVYDAPLIQDTLDATGKTFTISTDISGQWDGFSVFVQYMYNLEV